MSNNNKTPAIRFKGFTDTWEQREFGDENDLITGYPFESDCFSETGINLIRGMNVKRGYIDLSNDICVKWTSSKGLESYLLKENDIIIQMDGALIGKSYGIIKKKHLPALLVQRVTRARINNEIADSDFMYQTIQRDFLTYISMNKTETAVPHLSLNDIKNFGIMVPTLLEQKMIGSFFANLDRLITLHQRKCDKLIQFKAAMLKKMFPQNGADKPELRFKGFTDAWEQRKLGELMEITSVKRIHQSDWTDSGVRFLRARDIVAVSKNEEVSEPLFISQEKYDEYSALSGKVKIGDLLVTGVGTIGVPMLINNEEPLYFKDGNIIWFKNEDRIDGEFFYHSFNGSFIQNFIKESAGIGTVGTYTIESGKKTPILLPTQKDEQQKIGTFFSQLDTLITLHQRKCDKYKSIKAGLIRKFFP